MKRLAVCVTLLWAQLALALPVTTATIARDAKHLPLTLEVASTQQTRETGLMHRKTLVPYDGMLFLFARPQTVGFWMKNTLIPLDILYLDQDGTILHIAENTTPLSLTPIRSPATYYSVIELNGGRAKREALRAGQKVAVTIPKGVTIE